MSYLSSQLDHVGNNGKQAVQLKNGYCQSLHNDKDFKQAYHQFLFRKPINSWPVGILVRTKFQIQKWWFVFPWLTKLWTIPTVSLFSMNQNVGLGQMWILFRLIQPNGYVCSNFTQSQAYTTTPSGNFQDDIYLALMWHIINTFNYWQSIGFVCKISVLFGLYPI